MTEIFDSLQNMTTVRAKRKPALHRHWGLCFILSHAWDKALEGAPRVLSARGQHPTTTDRGTRHRPVIQLWRRGQDSPWNYQWIKIIQNKWLRIFTLLDYAWMTKKLHKPTYYLLLSMLSQSCFLVKQVFRGPLLVHAPKYSFAG